MLQDVGKLSEFKAIILLTDNVETARIWIEQTESERGEAPAPGHLQRSIRTNDPALLSIGPGGRDGHRAGRQRPH